MVQRFTFFICAILLLPVSIHAQLFPQLGAQRAGISALTFLKIDVSPRSASLGGANLCLSGDAFSTYTNPANLGEVEQFKIGASNTFWVAGINHAFASVVQPTKIGTLGLSVGTLTSGAMEVRTEFQPDGTGQYFYASNLAIGLSYAKRLTEMFSFGFSVKYINETLAEFASNTAVVDLGFLYRTDFKDLSFAVMIQSFGPNSTLKGEIEQDANFASNPVSLESYPAPTIFKLGVSMVPYKNEEKNQSLTTFIQLNHPNDNAENIRLGLEYNYKSLLFFRLGYKINVDDQSYPTAGLGLRMRIGKNPLQFDYAFDPIRYLGMVHRIGLTFSLNKETRE